MAGRKQVWGQDKETKALNKRTGSNFKTVVGHTKAKYNKKKK